MFLHSGHVDLLLDVNHLYKQLPVLRIKID